MVVVVVVVVVDAGTVVAVVVVVVSTGTAVVVVVVSTGTAVVVVVVSTGTAVVVVVVVVVVVGTSPTSGAPPTEAMVTELEPANAKHTRATAAAVNDRGRVMTRAGRSGPATLAGRATVHLRPAARSRR